MITKVRDKKSRSEPAATTSEAEKIQKVRDYRKQFEADMNKLAWLGKEPPTTVSTSGAKSSPVLPFDQIPYRLLIKLAERFQKGIPKYGRDNWRKGLADTEYVRERLAHGQRHLARLIEKVTDAHLGVVNPNDPKWEGEYWDDDVAAVAWMCAFMVETQWQKEWELERELKGKETR